MITILTKDQHKSVEITSKEKKKLITGDTVDKILVQLNHWFQNLDKEYFAYRSAGHKF